MSCAFHEIFFGVSPRLSESEWGYDRHNHHKLQYVKGVKVATLFDTTGQGGNKEQFNSYNGMRSERRLPNTPLSRTLSTPFKGNNKGQTNTYPENNGECTSYQTLSRIDLQRIAGSHTASAPDSSPRKHNAHIKLRLGHFYIKLCTLHKKRLNIPVIPSDRRCKPNETEFHVLYCFWYIKINQVPK